METSPPHAPPTRGTRARCHLSLPAECSVSSSDSSTELQYWHRGHLQTTPDKYLYIYIYILTLLISVSLAYIYSLVCDIICTLYHIDVYIYTHVHTHFDTHNAHTHTTQVTHTHTTHTEIHMYIYICMYTSIYIDTQFRNCMHEGRAVPRSSSPASK